MPHRNRTPVIPAPGTFCEGMIVRSRSGRDRKRFFIIMSVDASDRLSPIVIADGKLRLISDRKHKNPAHLDWISDIVRMGIEKPVYCLTDVEIAEICENAEKEQKTLDKQA